MLLHVWAGSMCMTWVLLCSPSFNSKVLSANLAFLLYVHVAACNINDWWSATCASVVGVFELLMAAMVILLARKAISAALSKY